MLNAIVFDVRYGARMFARQPGFTLVAVMTLALGIGANTAIFSVVNAVLLTGLPFPAPDRLIAVGQNDSRTAATFGNLSFLNFSDLREQAKSVERLAAFYNADITLTGPREATRLRGTVVTADLFPLLGASPAIGRGFRPEDDTPGGGRDGRAAILSWESWHQYFGGDPAVVGRSLTLNDNSFTVIGVMPAGFRFPVQPQPTELWISTALDYERSVGPGAIMNERGYRGWRVVGRLKPGVTTEQTQAEANLIAANLAARDPGINENIGLAVKPLLESLVGSLRPTLLVLVGAVAFVLLIACVNVANLLLERAITRQREITLRLALGAGRWRVTRQLLTESVLLAIVGGAAGALVAAWGIRLIVILSPEGVLRVAETRLDPRVLTFTALVSLATGITFGLAPALTIFRTDLVPSLKEAARGATGGPRSHRLSHLLVVGEISLALTLLVGAGLLIQSLMRLQQVDLGFDAYNMLTFNVTRPADPTSSPSQTVAFYQQLTERLETLPGVVNASVVFQPPLGGSAGRTGLSIEGKPQTANRTTAIIHSVAPEYFRTMRIRLVNGRDFSDRDNLSSTPVLIVNQALARQYFPNEDPIGKRIAPAFSTVPIEEGTGMREIVGVVADVKHVNLQGSAEPEIYFAQAQMPMAATSVVVRTASNPRSLINAARDAVHGLERNAPIYNVRTVEELLGRSVASPRFNSLLLVLFAGAALMLTTVGLYGVIARSVSQRTHEIGVRVALGAQPADVLKSVIDQGLVLALIGIGLGLVGAFVLTRLMKSMLFGVTPTDPLTFGGTALLLLGTAFLACLVPARRATKVDPMVALRTL